jgi:putative SOS response-associated peptidase YedK
MCGRFVRYSELKLIEKTFNVDEIDAGVEDTAGYNIAPTQKVLAVVGDTGNRRLTQFYWGLVPFWAKERSIGQRMINARLETAAEKPSFKQAFRRRRCLIVADGFYEWQGEKGQKRPWLLSPTQGGPFGFAGLWETWRDADEKIIPSCTIITTAAGAGIRDIHHRMPVILNSQAHSIWLDPKNQDANALKTLLLDQHVTELRRVAVSKRVNDVRNNDERCIAPLDAS